MRWKDLEVGSIVYLQNSEVCPADIIILDSSEVKEKEAFCIIDTAFVNGKTCLKKKKACSLTQSSYFYFEFLSKQSKFN